MEARRINRAAGSRMYFTVTADGKPTQSPCWGPTFKGPFRLPRMPGMADVMMGEILGA